MSVCSFYAFSRGGGLVAEGCIPKPTFWTFTFYKKLQQKKEGGAKCVYKDDNMVILKDAEGNYAGVAWKVGKDNSEDTDMLAPVSAVVLAVSVLAVLQLRKKEEL